MNFFIGENDCKIGSSEHISVKTAAFLFLSIGSINDVSNVKSCNVNSLLMAQTYAHLIKSTTLRPSKERQKRDLNKFFNSSTHHGVNLKH